MPPSLAAISEEIKRLEEITTQNVGAVRGLVQQVSQLTAQLGAIEVHRQRDKEVAERTEKQIEDLAHAIKDLSTTLATISGKAQGASFVVKAVWVVMGTIITGSIFWVSTTIVDLKTHVAVLESKEKPR